MLNKKEIVTEGQWDNSLFQLRCARALRNKPLEHIHLHRLDCSSSEVINQVFDQLAQAVNADHHLKSLTITVYIDGNDLERWTAQRLAQ